MAEQVDQNLVECISGFKRENGVEKYLVCWKPSWVKKDELYDCSNLIGKYILSNNSDRIDFTDSTEDNVVDIANSIAVETESPISIADDVVDNANSIAVETESPIVALAASSDDDNKKQKVKVEKEVCPIAFVKEQDCNSVHGKVLTMPSKQDWYAESEVKKQMIKFNDVCCKTPQSEMKEATGLHNIIMQQLELELADKMGCKKLEYTGSSYEGLKISDDGLEFDVMFIMDGKELNCEPIPGRDGYCNLVPNDLQNSSFLKILSDGPPSERILSPTKLRSRFFGAVQTFMNEKYPDTVKLISHGPAIQIDVKKKKSDKKEWYSVDLVPCYEVSNDGELIRYVPKPLIEPDDETAKLCNAWRRSFSQEEKQILKGLDRDNGCRRQVIRILKAMFKKDTTLNKLNSYHLKTMLFHVVNNDKINEKMSWKVTEYHDRVFDMLAIMEGYLDQKCLPQYYIPSMNLLGNMNEKILDNIKNRIIGLRQSKIKFLKAIQTV